MVVEKFPPPKHILLIYKVYFVLFCFEHSLTVTIFATLNRSTTKLKPIVSKLMCTVIFDIADSVLYRCEIVPRLQCSISSWSSENQKPLFGHVANYRELAGGFFYSYMIYCFLKPIWLPVYSRLKIVNCKLAYILKETQRNPQYKRIEIGNATSNPALSAETPQDLGFSYNI